MQTLAELLVKQRKGVEGRSQLALPFKHVLQYLPDTADLATGSSMVSSLLQALPSKSADRLTPAQALIRGLF